MLQKYVCNDGSIDRYTYFTKYIRLTDTHLLILYNLWHVLIFIDISLFRYRRKSASASSVNRAAVIKRTSSSNKFQNDNIQERSSVKSMVEVVSSSIVFPDTKNSEENFVKVKLRNHDSVVHTVRAEVTKAPFAVRHKQFQVKAGHYVSVPVYFRPQTLGFFTGQLNLNVIEEQVLHTVQLSGKAVWFCSFYKKISVKNSKSEASINFGILLL